MSKLSEMIQAVNTRQRVPVMSPLVAIEASVEANAPATYDQCYVYNLKATFGCTAVLKFEDPRQSDILRGVRKQVVDEIFGEFREHLHAAERALYNYDTEAALKALQALRNQMFEV